MIHAIRSALACLSLGVAGCAASPDAPAHESTAMHALTGEITEIAAVHPTTYPDDLGYVYQGPLANIFWLQSQTHIDEIDALTQTVARDMARGVTGEFLTSGLQPVTPVPAATPPSLPQMSLAVIEQVRQLGQYAALTADYSGALSTALGAYNGDPARVQAIAATAARLDAMLRASATPNPAGALPAPPPPVSQGVMRPGMYLTDAVRDHARAHLTRSVAQLEAAIANHDQAAYAEVFADVYLMQRDIDLAPTAAQALAVHHASGVLQGQPLDAVIANYVHPLPAPDRPLSVDQLVLINQINLLANNPVSSRSALVAALLLIDEYHGRGEQDATVSCSSIYQHVGDAAWLVAQLVRIKADGTTDDQVNAAIASIVASL